VVTPHVAGSTPRFPERAFRLARRQLERYLAREPLENVVSEGY
jgi:phosphoglycerate dehydrogenase-like enzyme